MLAAEVVPRDEDVLHGGAGDFSFAVGAFGIGGLLGAIGLLPNPGDLDTTGLDIDPSVLAELTSVPPAALRSEIADIRTYLKEFGTRTPAALYRELDDIERRLDA